MIFANVRTLKNKASELLRATRNGEDVVITYRGKPTALLRHFTEDEIEDYVLNHPKFQKTLDRSDKEYQKHGGIEYDEYMKRFGKGK